MHVTSIDRLLSPSAQAAVRTASQFVTAEATRGDASLWQKGVSSHDIAAEALLMKLPEIYMLGLESTILQLVQLYIGRAAAYHGAVIRRSLVDDRHVGTRLWHQDAEDVHVVRMVIYLNDVTEGGGPFEYVPRSTGLRYKRFAGGDGELTNERMRAVMPYDRWKRVTGPAGTVVLADTAKVFHHESLQTERERSVVMIGYSSRRPTGREYALRHFPVERVKAALEQLVPPANYGHVFDWRSGGG